MPLGRSISAAVWRRRRYAELRGAGGKRPTKAPSSEDQPHKSPDAPRASAARPRQPQMLVAGAAEAQHTRRRCVSQSRDAKKFAVFCRTVFSRTDVAKPPSSLVCASQRVRRE